MLLLRKPTPDTISRFLDEQRELNYSYELVGATAAKPPADYVLDHTRIQLGSGDEVFTAAKLALENWQQFRLGWFGAWPANTPIRQGEVVAIVARSIGLWWLNACRIVYLIDEELEAKKFGFAYGTLPDHAGSGEERFLIEMDQDESVWYDILAFSRPQHPLARIGYPFVRRIQKRFGRQSAGVMQEIVASSLTAATAK